MLRTTLFTLATVASLTAAGTLGLDSLIDSKRHMAPPISFGELSVVRGGVTLSNLRLINTRVRARAKTFSLRWHDGLRPTARIDAIVAGVGPLDAHIARVDAHPSAQGWSIEGVGQVGGHPVDFRGQVDIAQRALTLSGTTGPLFRGSIKGADVQFATLRVDASSPRAPSVRLTDVDVRRGQAWWGGGQVDVTRAACGVQPTLSGGQAWYPGSNPDGAISATAKPKPASPFACPVHVADLAVQLASPVGVRHIRLHRGNLQADSFEVQVSGPEGAGTLIAGTSREWAALDGSVDLAQLPDVLGVSATGAARGQLVIVRSDDTTRAYLQGQVDGEAQHPAIAADPVDVSGLAITASIEHQPGRLAVDLIELQRGGVQASAQIIADAQTVDLRAALAPTDCQALWSAIPSALRGPYANARLSGQIAPRIHFRLPRANAKKLTLLWEGPTDCTVDALATQPAHLPAAQVSGARDDVDWLLRDFRLPVHYATRPVEVGPGTDAYVPINQLPRWVGAAAIVSEDNSFNRGKALNLGLLRRALMFNLDRGRYVYGGSTIPQQLAKNLFLTRRKTLARKLQEAIVAMRMVQVVPTRRILELYLNCIEFAPNVYGIERAARHYFQKGARQLTPKEAAFLGISKPSPRYAAAMRRRGSTPDTAHFREYMRRIIERMRKRGAISSAQAAAARPFQIRWHGGRKISGSQNRPQNTQL